MSEDWFLAWTIATVVALVATPLLAHRAAPRPRRRASLATAAAPLLAVLATVPLAIGELDSEVAVVLIGAVWLWCAGQALERGMLPPVVRRFAIGIAATPAVLAGARLELVGVEVLDVVLSIAVVWGATSAWRSAETRDGLLLGWAAVIAAGAAVLGGLGTQPATAVLGAAVAGASFGFLPYVVPPVAARLRRGGALFLGFLAVGLASSADVPAPGFAATITLLLLVAVPLIDGTLAAAARRRGRGRDPRLIGLVGRWRALGLSRLTVTIGLVLLQTALVVVALFVGRGVIDVATGTLLGLVLLGLVVAPALLARLDAAPGRWPRWMFRLTMGIVVLIVLFSIPAALAMLRAREDTADGASAAQRALSAARRGNAEVADAAFKEAETHFAAAQDRLDGIEVGLGLAVPVLGPNLDAARDLVDVGVDLSRAGRDLTATADPERLRIVDTTVNLDELERLTPAFERTARLLTSAQDRIDDIDRTFLIPPIEDAIDKLDGRIDRAARDSETAAISARLLPSILGGDAPRRYLVAMQNNAEARATGGLVANYAELTAVDGHLDLGDIEGIRFLNPREGEPRTLEAPKSYVQRYGRFQPERRWQNVNASPDVPTVAAVEASLVAQDEFGPVDGVVTIDPIGLESILRITGPIEVPGWPERVTADNVVQATLHDAYVYFEGDNQRREDFLGDVVDIAWDAFNDRDLGSPAKVIKELAEATRTKHLTLWFADPKAQRLAERAGADGAVPDESTDLVLVTTGNAAQNKIDFYLERDVRYDVELFPHDDETTVTARGSLRVGLHNTAPAAGLPSYIIGSNRPDYGAGENGTFFSAYTELESGEVRFNGERRGVERQTEFGRNVYSRFLRIPAGATEEIDLPLAGKLELAPDGWYELALLTQPSVNPDAAEVVLGLPDGWRFADARGGLALADDGRSATYRGSLDRDRRLSVRIARDHGDGIWGHLVDSRPL